MRALTLLPLLLAAAPAPDERRFLIVGFERLRVEGPYDIEIVPGTTASATATGDARALAQLSLRSDGGTLVVSAGPEAWETRRGEQFTSPRIRMVTPVLRSVLVNGAGRVTAAAMAGQRVDVALNGSGTIDARGVDAREVNITVVGSGTITIAGKATSARIRSTGTGSVVGPAFTASTAFVIAETAGTTQLGAVLSAQVNAMGLGAVAITGPAECRVRGSGPVSCQGPLRR
jgi:hypothetical protein